MSSTTSTRCSTTVDEKGTQFNAAVDQLQQLITGLAQGTDPIAGAIATAGLGGDRPDRHAGQGPPAGAGRDREPAAAGAEARRTQGRRQRGHRAARRELPAAQRPWCLRLVLQHLLLLDPDEDQRPGGQRHPDSVRWTAGPVRRGGALLSRTTDDGRNPVRTGIFGIVLVACLVLVSFGYTRLPFWPQGKTYDAYFTDAGGISPGNDVNVSGIKVGQVESVGLAGTAAKVTFTVDRDVRVGDQSLAAIKTDTVLGREAAGDHPDGWRFDHYDPVGPHHHSVHPQRRAAGSRRQHRRAGQAEVRGGAADADRHTARRHPAVARRARRRGQPVAHASTPATRRWATLLQHAQSVTKTLADRAGQVNQLIVDGNQLFAALDERRQALSHPDRRVSTMSPNRFRVSSPTTARSSGRRWRSSTWCWTTSTSGATTSAEALKRLPPYATALGEVVGSAPGFQINLYGLPPATISEVLFDSYFQPGKLPDSLSDYLKGLIAERLDHQAEVAMTPSPIVDLLHRPGRGCWWWRWRSVCSCCGRGAAATRWSALFSSAVGLYPGDEVRVVGVPVGKIDSIEPRADDVKVTMSVSDDVKRSRRRTRHHRVAEPGGGPVHSAHPGLRRRRTGGPGAGRRRHHRAGPHRRAGGMGRGQGAS